MKLLVWNWKKLLSILGVITLTSLSSQVQARGIINIEIDADTITIPTPGPGDYTDGNCHYGQGAFASDPSLPFSINIATNVEPARIGSDGCEMRTNSVYNKYIDFKDMEGPYNVSWKVMRYSGLYGNPTSTNPADWVPVSPNGLPCTQSPYLALVESGNNLEFAADKFTRAFYDAVPLMMYGNSNLSYEHTAQWGIRGDLMDYDPDHRYDNYDNLTSMPQQGCFFYALEVTVNGITALARTNVTVDDNGWATYSGSTRHASNHVMQLFDKGTVNASTIDPRTNTEYDALAFEEESRTFYYVNYVNAAQMIPVADSEQMINQVFAVGPILPLKYLAYRENMETGNRIIPNNVCLAMRIISPYLKYWDLGVTTGTKTGIGLVIDVFECWKNNKYTQHDLYSWANACQLMFGFNFGDSYPQIFIARPYLPQARLTEVDFTSDLLTDASSIVTNNIFDEAGVPTTFNDVRHNKLCARVKGIIPYTPDAIEMPLEADNPIKILTKIQGVQITIGSRTYNIDLDKTQLADDGSFEAIISGLDPYEIMGGNDTNTIDAYVSNTKWYTWAPLGATSNFSNEWNVYTPNPTKVQATVNKQIDAPSILAADITERVDYASFTKTLILNSVTVGQPTSSLNGDLTENLILTIGALGSEDHVLVTLNDNPFHSQRFFEDYTNLNVELGTIGLTTEWPKQEITLSQAFFFDVTEHVQGGEKTIITGATISNPNSDEYHYADFSNAADKETDEEETPSVDRPNRANVVNGIDHVTILSPKARYVYTVQDTTGVTDLEDTADYTINGRQVTVTADNVSIYTTAGVRLIDQPGTYTLQPGVYIVNNGAKASTILVK